MRAVHACVAEANASERACQDHLGLGFAVSRVFCDSRQVPDTFRQCPSGKYIRDRIAALISWTVEGIDRSRRPLIVRNSSIGFKRVKEHVQARGNVHSLRAGVLMIFLVFGSTNDKIDRRWCKSRHQTKGKTRALTVFSGSTIPSIGLRARFAIPVLADL